LCKCVLHDANVQLFINFLFLFCFTHFGFVFQKDFFFWGWVLCSDADFWFENLWAQDGATRVQPPRIRFLQKIYDSCIEHAVRHSNCYSNWRKPWSTLNKAIVRPALLVGFLQNFLWDNLYPGDTFFISVTSGCPLLLFNTVWFSPGKWKRVLILVCPPSVSFIWQRPHHDDADKSLVLTLVIMLGPGRGHDGKDSAVGWIFWAWERWWMR
jgi:hypothetical protein